MQAQGFVASPGGAPNFQPLLQTGKERDEALMGFRSKHGKTMISCIVNILGIISVAVSRHTS